MKLTQENIEEINKKCPYDQGVFNQPTGISTDIKTPVIYMRWESEGRPGSCWDDEDTENETYYNDKPKFKALDLVLAVIKPDISYLQYKEVENLIKESSQTDNGYYGDYSEYTHNYIVLDELYNLLGIS